MPKGLRAGAATAIINPALGARKGGYRLFGEPISAIDDDLHLSVLVVDSASNKLAIIAADLGNATPSESNEIRDNVAEALSISRANVMFNVSHNHSAATLPRNNGSHMSEEDLAITRPYYKKVVQSAVDCAIKANNSLRDARMATSWGSSNLNVYRREWQGDQDVLGEVLDHPVDNSVGVIRFDDLNGKAIAVLFRYSCHPVVNGAASRTLSADFPGPARKIVREYLGGEVFFLQGCGGNLNPRVGIGYEVDCLETVNKVGTSLGAEVLRVALGIETNRYQGERIGLNGVPNILFKPWQVISDHPELELAATEETVAFEFLPLPDRKILEAEEIKWKNELKDRVARNALSWEIRAATIIHDYVVGVLARAEEQNPTCDFLAQAMRIGETAFVGLGVEAFFETGEQIKSESPWPDTFVLGYTNGLIMYLPRKQDYPKNGWKWPNNHALPDLLPQNWNQPALWHPDSEQKAVAAAVRALNRIK